MAMEVGVGWVGGGGLLAGFLRLSASTISLVLSEMRRL